MVLIRTWLFGRVEPVRFPGRGVLLTLLMADGAQAAFLLTVIPFVLFRSGGLPLAVASSALGIGYGLGIAATLVFGRLADRKNPYAVLQAGQYAQLILLLTAAATTWIPSAGLVVVSVTGAIAVLRGVGPLKDRVRALHVPATRRGTFNSQVRRWFLVLGEIAVAAAAVLLTVIPTRLIPLSLVIPAVLVIVSLTATGRLRRYDRAGQESDRLRTSRQNAQLIAGLSRRQFAVSLLIVALCVLGSALPSVGLSSWIASTHAYPPVVLPLVSITILAADFTYMKLVGDRLQVGDPSWRRMPLVAGVGLGASVVAVAWFTLAGPRGVLGVIVLVACLIPGVIAYSSSVLVSMALQFSYGPEETRGRIASYTRIAANLGMTIGSVLGPWVFLGHPLWVGLFGLAVGAVTLLLPIRSAHISP